MSRDQYGFEINAHFATVLLPVRIQNQVPPCGIGNLSVHSIRSLIIPFFNTCEVVALSVFYEYHVLLVGDVPVKRLTIHFFQVTLDFLSLLDVQRNAENLSHIDLVW